MARKTVREGLGAVCVWTIKERDAVTGLYVPVLRRKNKITNHGVTALASAISGGYVAPIYLALDAGFTTLYNSPAAGTSTVQTNNVVDITGDTQLVVGLGLSTQETVTFSSRSGSSAPYNYNLSTALVNTHTAGEIVVRQVTVSDNVAALNNEIQYDSVNAPNARLAATAGYSGGAGIWTQQFYYSALSAEVYIAGVGLTDSVTVGAGNLHNHCLLGYDHTAGVNDCEIDVQLTITGN